MLCLSIELYNDKIITVGRSSTDEKRDPYKRVFSPNSSISSYRSNRSSPSVTNVASSVPFARLENTELIRTIIGAGEIGRTSRCRFHTTYRRPPSVILSTLRDVYRICRPNVIVLEQIRLGDGN